MGLLTFFLFAFGEKLIQSGEKPSQPSLQLTFKEYARVSAEDEDIGVPWYGPAVSLDNNKQGHVYLIDPAGFRILHFDGEGQWLGEIGGQGQGPGEFSSLIGARVLANGRLTAVNNTGSHLALMTFNEDGTYRDQKLIATANRTFQTAIPDAQGTHLLALSIVTGSGDALGKLFFETGLLHIPELDSKLMVSRVPEVPFDPSRLESATYWSEYLADLFGMTKKGLGLMAFQSQGGFLAAKTDQYEIGRYDASGTLRHIIKRDYRPVPLRQDEIRALSDPIFSEVVDAMPPQVHMLITKNVIDKAIEKAELAPVKPPILALIPFEDNRFLVVRDTRNGHVSADLFSEEGKFQARVELPPIPVNMFGAVFGAPSTLRFHKDKAYALARNENDDLDLVFYTWTLK